MVKITFIAIWFPGDFFDEHFFWPITCDISLSTEDVYLLLWVIFLGVQAQRGRTVEKWAQNLFPAPLPRACIPCAGLMFHYACDINKLKTKWRVRRQTSDKLSTCSRFHKNVLFWGMKLLLNQRFWDLQYLFFLYSILLFSSLQAAIVVVFNFLAVIVIFPAMIVIDKNRRRSGKYDLLCCCERLVCVRWNLTDLKLSVNHAPLQLQWWINVSLTS